MKYYFYAFKNYFKNDGRATRKEYWWFILFHYVVILILSFLDGFLGFYSEDITLDYGYLTLVYLFISACPSICLQVRRLHDIGKSGKWWWLKRVPILAWYIIYLNCKAGDPQINIYGAPVNDKLVIEGNCCKEIEKVPLKDVEEPLTEQSCEARSAQFSLSTEGEPPRAYGNYNVYGSDMALDSFSLSQEQQEVSVSGDQEQPAQTMTPIAKRCERYCFRCGNIIDPGTKKCAGCGKQYFKRIRFTKFSIAITALALVIATLSTFCILQYANIEALNDKVSTLESQASNKQATIYSLTGRVNNLQNQVQENKELADFIDDYVVFIEDDGTDLYHKYKCYKFKGESFWVLNINAAKEDGYKACPNCH